jgi:integrase
VNATGLVLAPTIDVPPYAVDPRLSEIKRVVLDSVVAANSKRNYAKALDHLFAFAAGRPLTRALLLEWRAGMDKLSPSTVNVRLSAMRKLVTEALRNGLLGADDAANLTGVPNLRQSGTRLGNWLTREQTKELLLVPDRATLKGKRDYVILALLVGCALRRQELAQLDVETIQMREGRWVLADLCGKGQRIRTVAVPLWVKQGINAWLTAARIEEGRLLRPVLKGGKLKGESLTDWSIWSSSNNPPNRLGSSTSVPMICAGPAPSCAGSRAATSNKSSSCSGIHQSRPRNGILGPNRRSPSR